MTQNRQKQKKPGPVAISLLIILAAALLAGTIAGAVWLSSFADNMDKLLRFQQYLRSIGWGGWLILLALQYFNIVVAFIPGGPIQILAGALFGPWLGMFTCLLGCAAATATVFALVRKYGHRALSIFVDKNSVQKYKFLSNARRLEFLTLVLFFIPGLPKDALTYLFALTPIKLTRFLLLSTLARTPALLTSIFMGDSLIAGHWQKALLLFLVITVICAGGLLLYRRVIEPHLKFH